MTDAPKLSAVNGEAPDREKLLAELAAMTDEDARLQRVHEVIRQIAGAVAQVRHNYRDAIVGAKWIRRDDWRVAESEARAEIKAAAQRAATEARRASSPDATALDAGEEMPPPTVPMAVARRLLAADKVEGQLTTRYWRGGWMTWTRTCWAETEQDAIKSRTYQKLEHAKYVDESREFPEVRPWSPNRRRVADVLDALASVVYLSETVHPPAWLRKPPTLPDGTPVPPSEIVACANGLLHIGTRTLLPLTPIYFNQVAVPFDHDPQAPAPSRWLEFLGQLWPEDPEAPGVVPDQILALQEFFGYVLSGRTDLQKILLLIGPTRSGKGTIARVLTALVGKANVVGPTLASLGTNFGLEPLLGKPLGIISDARLGSGNVPQVVERLLTISGEDMLTVDVKFRKPWSGKLPTRLMILSNELPRLGDASGAIAHRFIILTQTVSFLGNEDALLTAKLLEDLPGILNWALDGLTRLGEQKVFTQVRGSADAIKSLQDIASPVSAFVRDVCERDPAAEVLIEVLFAAWREWCDLNGRDHVGSVQTFGRDLRAVIPGLRVAQPRAEDSAGVNAVRARRYVGVRLAPRIPQGSARNDEDRVPPRADHVSARGGTRENPLRAEPLEFGGDGESDRVGCRRCACGNEIYRDDESVCSRCRMTGNGAA